MKKMNKVLKKAIEKPAEYFWKGLLWSGKAAGELKLLVSAYMHRLEVIKNIKVWIKVLAVPVLSVFLILAISPVQELILQFTIPCITFRQEQGSNKKNYQALENEIERRERKLVEFTPRSAFLVINATDNQFRLYMNRRLIRQGSCSTGSYIMLEAGHDQKWIFRTPRGIYRIQGKTVAPVWKKPDWAFVEEGLPVPPPDHHSRFEYGVLGEYALSIGDGYLIHGTLYKRFLGQPVTHGCVRMDDADLEAVYEYLDIGSRVYIY